MADSNNAPYKMPTKKIPTLLVTLLITSSAAPARESVMEHGHYSSPEARAQNQGSSAAIGMGWLLGVVEFGHMQVTIKDDHYDPRPGLILDPNIPMTRWDLEDYKVDGTGRKQQGGLSGSVQAEVGYDGNTQGDAFNVEDSTFIGLDLRARYLLPDVGHIAIGATQRWYENAPRERDGADDSIQNYSGEVKLRYELADGIIIGTHVKFDYGGLGNVTKNDTTNGVLEHDRTFIQSRFDLTFPINDKATIGTVYENNYYNQSSEDRVDTGEHSFGVNFTQEIHDDLDILAGLTYRRRNWFEEDLDSDGYRLDLGIRGEFPCGVNYFFGLNHEWRDYDNPYLDDRRMFGYQAEVEGEFDEYKWGIYSRYGFADPNLPGASWLTMADANGKLFGGYLSRQFGDDFVAMLYCYSLYLDADIFAGSDTSNLFTQTGVRLEKKVTDALTVGGTLAYERHEFENGGNTERDSSPAASVFIRHNW